MQVTTYANSWICCILEPFVACTAVWSSTVLALSVDTESRSTTFVFVCRITAITYLNFMSIYWRIVGKKYIFWNDSEFQSSWSILTVAMAHVRTWFKPSITRTFITSGVVSTLAVTADGLGFALIDICQKEMATNNIKRQVKICSEATCE